MNKLAKLTPWLVALIALAFLSGCCAVPKKAAPTPQPPKKWVAPAPAPVKEQPEAPPALPTSYTVEKCDDLWSISAKPQIYNDPWMWPCLFDANKAKIKNANKIAPGTVLSVPRGLSDADKAACRSRAQKFPKYMPPKGAKRYCPPK